MALKKFFEFSISESEEDLESLISGFEDLGISEKPKVWFFILDWYKTKYPENYGDFLDSMDPNSSWLIVVEAYSEKKAMDILSEYSREHYGEGIPNQEDWDQFCKEFEETVEQENDIKLDPSVCTLRLYKEFLLPAPYKSKEGLEKFKIYNRRGGNKILNQELIQKYGVGIEGSYIDY